MNRTGRRRLGPAILSALLLLGAAAGTVTTGSAAGAATSPRYQVGRGIADVTGPPAGADKMGYEAPLTKTVGLRDRLHARAFVVVDTRTGKRVAIAVGDIGQLDNTLRDAVIARVQQSLGSAYNANNVLLTATHTHSSPGGFLHYNIDNLGTPGFRQEVFDAIVEGFATAIIRAHRDLAPGDLALAVGTLTDASANRSITGFEQDSAAEQAFFPAAIDPQTTVLQMTRNGTPVGAINWFATHGTSMTKDGVLINGDNKGYAAYYWEHVVHHVDYLATSQAPPFVAGFAQTNAGDMTPDLALRPGTGPTTDDLANTKIIGARQYAAAANLANGPQTQISGQVDYRFAYVDIAHTTVSPTYTGDGQSHNTCSGTYGVSFAAGSKEDGPGFDFLHEGTGNNPVVDQLTGLYYVASPSLKACQAPKDILLDTGDLGWSPNIAPIQLVRIGQLYLIAAPSEFTVVAGLRIRKVIAGILHAPLEDVLLAGYSNDYTGYTTTPQEYDAGNYEAGHTLYGRWTLPAWEQQFAGLAQAMAAGSPTASTVRPPNYDATLIPAAPDPHLFDVPMPLHNYGDVLTQPNATYQKGQTVQASFVGAYPNRSTRHGLTYLAVDRLTAGGWVRVADDNDWSTSFAWKDQGLGASTVTVSWEIPETTRGGTYRVRFLGDARSATGTLSAISGTSRTFTVLS